MSTSTPSEALSQSLADRLDQLFQDHFVEAPAHPQRIFSDAGLLLLAAEHVVSAGLKPNVVAAWLNAVNWTNAMPSPLGRARPHVHGARLDDAAIEDLLGVSDLLVRATRCFGEGALVWATSPHPLLAHQRPCDVVMQEHDRQRVHNMLIAIEYGGVV